MCPSTNAQAHSSLGQPQDIIVTGSRIPQPNLESASPVTSSRPGRKLSGTTRIEDVINQLPVSRRPGLERIERRDRHREVNLRGLGAKRTLVLVNGRRLIGRRPAQRQLADINIIPLQLVKRVDVLTGGASAVYGADAVAGVVNFIMDDSFTGFRIDAQASTFNHQQHMGDDLVAREQSLAGYRFPHGMSTNGGAQDIAGVFGAAFDDGRGHARLMRRIAARIRCSNRPATSRSAPSARSLRRTSRHTATIIAADQQPRTPVRSISSPPLGSW